MTTRASGWVLYASTLLVLLGIFNVIEGLAALFSDDVFVVSEGQLLVFDFTTWGVLHLIWGVVMVIVGFSVASGQEWARWVAVFVACVSAIAHVAFIVAFPLWAVIMIALDVLVIYGLVARWDDETTSTA
jgi:hypothetical protein